MGLRTALTVTRDTATLYTLTVRYDDRGRPLVLTDTTGATYTAEYDAAGQLLALAFPNGVTQTYRYDPAGHLLGTTVASDGVALADYAYAYNDLGLRTTLTATVSGTAWVDRYGYDALYRLAQWTREGVTTTWAYDPVGNRLAMTATAGVVTTTTYTYDAADQLLTLDGPTGVITFTYDGNGSLVGRELQTPTVTLAYRWDSANRLVGITSTGGLSLSFAYDAQGRRVRRADDSGATYSLYDGWSVLLEGGNSTLTQGLIANVFGLGGLQAQVDGSGPRYAHGEALGSVGLWTDAAGAVATAMRYEPFGAAEVLTGTGAVYGFVGRQGVRADGDAGLLLMGHRYYDPSLGRFLSRDPMPGLTIAPRTQHPYVYVGNDPVNKVDPLGLWFFDQVVNAVGGFFSGLADTVWQGYQAVNRWTGGRLEQGRQFAAGMLANPGQLVDMYLSLILGYALMKEVNKALYGVSGLDPRAVDWELQGRYTGLVNFGVQTLAVGTVCAMVPPAGVALSGYSVFWGRDPFSGRELNNLEWGLAVVGLAGSAAYMGSWLDDLAAESDMAAALAGGRRQTAALEARAAEYEAGAAGGLDDAGRMGYTTNGSAYRGGVAMNAGGGAPQTNGSGRAAGGSVSTRMWTEDDVVFPADVPGGVAVDLGTGGNRTFPKITLPDIAARYPNDTVIGVDSVVEPVDARLMDVRTMLQPEAMASVRGYPNARFVIGDYSAIADESAGLVTSFAPTPSAIKRTVEESARIVRPGGTVLIASQDFIRLPGLSQRYLTAEQAAQILGELTGGQVEILTNVPCSRLVGSSFMSGKVTVIRVVKPVLKP